jgi:hypothetical protein
MNNKQNNWISKYINKNMVCAKVLTLIEIDKGDGDCWRLENELAVFKKATIHIILKETFE